MARYIDANAYIKYCEENWIPLNIDAVRAQPTADVVSKELYDRLLKNSIIISEALNRYQTADVVEVVRCKECKHWNTAECHSTAVPDVRKCMVMNVFTNPDQFCKYGERRDDDRNG